jgi:hypothetical protein
MVTRTVDELAEMQKQIAAGELPPNAIEQYYEDERKNVFGHNYKRDSKGQPIEVGIGSPSQPSFNSVEAYRKYGRDEPDYARHLARMEKELADYQQARRKAGAAQQQSQGRL